MKNIFLITLLSLFASSPSYAFFIRGGTTPPPILDTITCQSTSDAAYGTVKLRTAYSGSAFQMRVKQSGVYVTQDIGFSGTLANYSAADTFAATADANTPAELRFYDQCGNGNDTSFLDSSTKGAVWSPYKLGPTAIRTAAFDVLYDNSTTPSKQVLVLPTTMAMNMDAFSVVLIGRRGSAYSAQPLSYWEFKNTAPWFSDWYSYNDGEHIKEANGTTLNYNTLETGQGVYMNIIAPTTSVIRTNETSSSKVKATLSAVANNGGTLGFGQILGTYNGGQDIAAQMFFNRTLSASEQTQLANYGYGLVGNTPVIPTCVVVMGDSGSQAAFVAYNQNPINQAIKGVATPINKPVRVFNTATSGQTASTILSNIANFTGTCAQTGVTKKIAVILAGANDINTGSSAVTVENTLHSIWTAMHNAGFSVVCTTMNNSNISNAGLLATVNTNIESNYSSNNCDALADTWLDSNIGAASNNANFTYWYTDRVHLTVNGNNIVGQYQANAINTVD